MADASDSEVVSGHPVYRLSGIARPVDPRYPTNKAVLILAPLFGASAIGWKLWTGTPWSEGLGAGLNVALLVLATWALTRELSPDDNPAAFVAVGLGLAVWPRVGQQSILILFTVLLCVRLVNRSTGKAAEISDGVVTVLGLGALTWLESWALGLGGALALVLDALLPVPGQQIRRKLLHLGLAALLLVVVAVRVVYGVDAPRLPAHLPVFAGIAGMCALAAGLHPRPRSCGDVDAAPLERVRVRLGLGLGLALTVLLSLDPQVELTAIAGLWACILAVPLALPVQVLRQRRRERGAAT